MIVSDRRREAQSMSCSRGCALGRLVERHEVVAYPEGAEMADDGGQRVVQAQADASCSAGSACNDGRDAVNHINELGVRHGASAGRLGVGINPANRVGFGVAQQRVAGPGPGGGR